MDREVWGALRIRVLGFRLGLAMFFGVWGVLLMFASFRFFIGSADRACLKSFWKNPSARTSRALLPKDEIVSRKPSVPNLTAQALPLNLNPQSKNQRAPKFKPDNPQP